MTTINTNNMKRVIEGIEKNTQYDKSDVYWLAETCEKMLMMLNTLQDRIVQLETDLDNANIPRSMSESYLEYKHKYGNP